LYKIDQAVNVRKDELLNLNSLKEYLSKKLNINSKIELLQFPSGFSNLTYLIKTDNNNFVLRRPPHGSNVKSGHDMNREFMILNKLKNHFNKVPNLT
jgi:aminoglycoside phosphotransferase (APT) family kinase protein